jgi:hypothetical protein
LVVAAFGMRSWHWQVCVLRASPCCLRLSHLYGGLSGCEWLELELECIGTEEGVVGGKGVEVSASDCPALVAHLLEVRLLHHPLMVGLLLFVRKLDHANVTLA